MKRMLAFIMMALIVLSACEKAEKNVIISSEGEVTTESFNENDIVKIKKLLKSSEHLVGYSSANGNGAFCDGGDICYFVSRAYAHSLIVSYDKETGEAAPLCKRENCSHDDINCSANIGAACSELAYHDGKLYWVEADTGGDADFCLSVYCEDAKSTVRTVIKTVILGNAAGTINVRFNDGKLIYTDAMYKEEDGAIHTVFGIADLNGEDDTVLINDESNEFLGLSFPMNIDIRLIDSTVYYTTTSRIDPNDENSDVRVGIYSYDLKTGTFSTVCRLSSESGDIPKASGFKLLNSGELYFMTIEAHKICRYNIDEGNWQALFDFSEYGDTYGFPNGQIRDHAFIGEMCCIAAVNNGKTIIAAKDMNGNLVFETDISEFADNTDGHFSIWISGLDSENVYCCFSFQDVGYTYQLDKTVGVPIDGNGAMLMYQNRSSLNKNWSK